MRWGWSLYSAVTALLERVLSFGTTGDHNVICPLHRGFVAERIAIVNEGAFCVAKHQRGVEERMQRLPLSLSLSLSLVALEIASTDFISGLDYFKGNLVQSLFSLVWLMWFLRGYTAESPDYTPKSQPRLFLFLTRLNQPWANPIKFPRSQRPNKDTATTLSSLIFFFTQYPVLLYQDKRNKFTLILTYMCFDRFYSSM